jgi:membrane-bound lytic murein transglycosylase B
VQRDGRAHGLGVLLAAALALAGCDTSGSGDSPAPAQASPPAPGKPIPRDPDRLAAELAQTTPALLRAIDRWRSEGRPERGGPPRDVTLLALYQQRIYVFLTERARLARQTLARLPAALRPAARDILTARSGLSRITPPQRPTRFRTGRAQPAEVLLGHYRAAERRFGVEWQMLAALNYVESAFNKLRNDSYAGAQGPMQFIPSTWRAYGMGGDVHDPRDAIMGAANYLRASGAPRDYRRALYAYNRSLSYVDAILRYARRIRRDPRAYYAFYSWQVFVKTPSGARRLTGPGV